MIFIASDHRGYELKSYLVSHLNRLNIAVSDLGPFDYDPEDDYPRYASLVCQEVLRNKDSKGILICGSGVGIGVAANKFSGIRASIGYSVPQVEAGRLHDDMNILVLASNFIPEEEAERLVKAFVDTMFDGQERHKRRLAQIAHFEKY